MDNLINLYEYVRIAFYILSGLSFYFCFNLLYIASVGKQLEQNYSQDYQQRFFEETLLSVQNINYIWRKIHHFGLIGTLLMLCTGTLEMFVPIVFVLFSIYYISVLVAKRKASIYGKAFAHNLYKPTIDINSNTSNVLPKHIRAKIIANKEEKSFDHFIRSN